MGKTTLLQQVAGELLDGFRPVGIDLVKVRTPNLKQLLTSGRKSLVLLMDNCDVLLPDPRAFVKQVHELTQKMDKAGWSLVWAGEVSWGEWAMAHPRDFGHPIRYYPLGVLPPKEVRPILFKNLPEGTSSAEVERLLDLSGGHPYLLKALLNRQETHLDGFFARLWKAAGSVSEQAVLKRLISAGSWVFLDDLRDGAGRKPPKPVLDRLASLGLIIRTLVDGAAAARIVSPLLLDWVRFSDRFRDAKENV